MHNNTIRILTRDSFLALAQTIQVTDYLMKKGLKVDIKALKTSGDIKLDAPLYQIAQEKIDIKENLNSATDLSKEGKAFFTKELEDGLLNNEGDLAIHSLKDLPTALPDGLVFSSAIMPVESSDTLVTLEKLPEEMVEQLKYLNSLVIGTSSLRRISAIKRWLPDTKLLSVRGNLVTRLEKLLHQKGINGLLLATAGLKRLYAFYKLWDEKRETWIKLLDSSISDRIDTDFKRLTDIFNQKLFFYEIDSRAFPPAVSQGVLGVETRSIDQIRLSDLFDRNELLDNRIQLERQLLSKLEAGCHIPYGNHVQLQNFKNNDYFQITTFYARNFNPEKTTKVDYFTAERLVSVNYNQKLVETLVNEIKGEHFPVIFCGLKNDDFINSMNNKKFLTHHIPLIKIEANLNSPKLLEKYDVAVVVSKNSVDHFPETLPQIDHWVSVGEKTGEYLQSKKNILNITIPTINDGFSSAKSVQELTADKSANVIWFGALNGKKDGIDLLKSKGYNITVYEGYQTLPEKYKLPDSESNHEDFLDKTAWWVFTSPSSAQSYIDQKLHRNSHLISVIGNTTAEVFFINGIIPYHISGKSDVKIMAEEIAGVSSQNKWKTKQWSL
ncbi:MAG: uroporphyrinogen-III synthase [Spirochaetia bacterium]|nr:uroporphyrinogen-III synthase [Spirochaetia bacterium]